MNKIKPAGIFFSLPREIRDEIYRHLVKGHYLFYQSPVDEVTTVLKAVLKTPFGSPNFAIFQVSKATYNEATLIFYSESVFQYQLDEIQSSITYPPGPAKNRMMKILLEFDNLSNYGQWYSPYRNETEHNLQATIDNFTGLSSVRTIIYIKLKVIFVDIHRMLDLHFFQRLKTLVSFRTVIVEVGPASGPASATGRKYHGGEEYKSVAQAIEEEMVLTMGPASLSQVDRTTYLEFHPLEHMRANLGAHAQRLQMETDKMKLVKERLEEGN